MSKRWLRGGLTPQLGKSGVDRRDGDLLSTILNELKTLGDG